MRLGRALVWMLPWAFLAACEVGGGDAAGAIEGAVQVIEVGSDEPAVAMEAPEVDGMSAEQAQSLSDGEARALAATGGWELIECPKTMVAKAELRGAGAPEWAWESTLVMEIERTIATVEVSPEATVEYDPFEDEEPIVTIVPGVWHLFCGDAPETSPMLEFGYTWLADGRRRGGHLYNSEPFVHRTVAYDVCYAVPGALGFICK